MKQEVATHAQLIKKIVFTVPLLVLLICALANITVAASVSDVGAQTRLYDDKAIALAAHSDILMQELASKQSLSSLKVWALQEGFVPQSNLTVVESSARRLARVDIQ